MPDATVVVRWVIPEAGSDAALALPEAWSAEATVRVVPTLVWSEVADVLHRRTLAGDLEPATARRLLRALLRLGIETRKGGGLTPRALKLATELALGSACNAGYLALAEAKRAEFWTFGERLAKAARRKLQWVRLAREGGR